MKKIKKDSFDNLTSIKNISYSIYENLFKLASLELNNDVTDKERIINLLKSTLMVEKSLYDKINYLNKEEIYNIINTIDDEDYAYNVVTDLNTISICNKEEIILRRINNEIVNRTNYLSTKVIEDMDIYNIEEVDKINKSVRLDYLRSVIFYINKLLKDKDYESVKENLVLLKYKLAMIDNSILEELLQNDFTFNNDLYWNEYLVSNIYGFNNIIIDYFKSDIINNILSTYLNDSIIASYDKYNDNTKDFYTTTLLVYIKALLLFCDNEIIEDVRKYLTNIINIEENTIKINRVVVNDLLKIIDESNKEKEVPNIITLIKLK